MWQELLQRVKQGDSRSLARSISLVENEYPGYEQLLQGLPATGPARVIGITGPPGAGKSTLTDALTGELVGRGRRVAILCVDPSSPFHHGAVLGDRVRMSDWYTHEQVYIRSLASRGAVGGLHPKIIEITDLLRAAPYDYILVETVGVGQSEIEIAGLADVTVVVLVPEAGDEIQTMKAGLMEVADLFVVNKADRPDADLFVRNLQAMLKPSGSAGTRNTPVYKTVATARQGIAPLLEEILRSLESARVSERRLWLLAEKAWQLIVQRKMKQISKQQLKERIAGAMADGDFHLYTFINTYLDPTTQTDY
ncbi:MAG TPA: methylmalonyl Co-A mutase-associated GTPase MeaB [Chitinophagaceae bacterium]|nr:methylmalonyl Co-A mutase-associated GTPase MeaB [Chitinophagaceae bacterium]